MVTRMALMAFHKSLLRKTSAPAFNKSLLRTGNTNPYGYFLRKDIVPIAVGIGLVGITAYALSKEVESITGKKK